MLVKIRKLGSNELAAARRSALVLDRRAYRSRPTVWGVHPAGHVLARRPGATVAHRLSRRDLLPQEVAFRRWFALGSPQPQEQAVRDVRDDGVVAGAMGQGVAVEAPQDARQGCGGVTG